MIGAGNGWATPRPGYLLLGAVAATVLLEVALSLYGFISYGFGSIGLAVAETGVSIVALCGPPLIAGLPVALLLRVFARRSFVANLLGFAAVVLLVPLVWLLASGSAEEAIGAAMLYTVFDVIAVAVALLLDRRSARRMRPDLTDTFA